MRLAECRSYADYVMWEFSQSAYNSAASDTWFDDPIHGFDEAVTWPEWLIINEEWILSEAVVISVSDRILCFRLGKTTCAVAEWQNPICTKLFNLSLQRKIPRN